MKSKLFRIAAAAIVSAALVFASTGCAFGGEKSVATMGDEKITESEYMLFVNLEKMQFQSNTGIQDLSTTLGTETAEEYIKRTALEKVSEYKIELIKAKEAKITLDDEDEKQINEYFDQFIEESGSKSDADKEIKKQLGISLDKYKEIFKNITLTEKFREQEINKIALTDEDVKKEYESNRDNYDYVIVRHILFLTVDQNSGEPLDKEKQDEAKKKADEMLEKVKAGENMETLALENSEDPSVQRNKGQFQFDITGRIIGGTVTDVLVSEFPKWAFKAKVGDADIVNTDYGYHVVKLEKRSDFEELKDNLKYYLQQQKYQNESLKKWKAESKFKVEKNAEVYDAIKLS